ncbi:MAG: rod shape-determining protein MreD [Moraxella sp.]|nr:rod shape-determining protein MreD [Moraxella sp.]
MKPKALLIMGMMVSFVVASMLNIYPLKYAFASIRPMFLVMVLAFWVIYRSTMLSVWVVFLVGLVSDLLFGTHLGHQAFCATLMAFVLRAMLIYAKELTLVQSWMLAVVGLLVYQGTLWFLQALTYHEFMWTGVGSLISSMALFPLLWVPLYWINGQLKGRAY